MITPVQVRALAMALPEAEDRSTGERLAFEVSGKGFAWSWFERPAPKARRRPRLDVLAVRCQGALKAVILEAEPDLFVHDDHYNGFPAVLVRLDRVSETRLAQLLTAGWFCQAPKALATAWAGKI